MRLSEFDTSLDKLDEIAPLVSMANWFGQKYHDVIATGSQKLGQGAIQQFTNKHLRMFMQRMGSIKLDWPTVTMNFVYLYLRRNMRLSDQDIVECINSVLQDPAINKSPIKKLPLSKIQDVKKQLTVISLFTPKAAPAAKPTPAAKPAPAATPAPAAAAAPAAAPISEAAPTSPVNAQLLVNSQKLIEAFIAAGAVRAVENHWADTSERPRQNQKSTASRTGRSTTAAGASKQTTAAGTSQPPSAGLVTPANASQKISAANAALSQLGAP